MPSCYIADFLSIHSVYFFLWLSNYLFFLFAHIENENDISRYKYLYYMPRSFNPFYIVSCKKKYQLLYKMGQDFLNIRYYVYVDGESSDSIFPSTGMDMEEYHAHCLIRPLYRYENDFADLSWKNCGIFVSRLNTIFSYDLLEIWVFKYIAVHL